ncbi:thiamine pyrophosphate-binding protein [Lysinimonas soli]|uniref:Thiamine pyrophosphate-binding protein n=1 Tax=Lysinimonas soli TaxID=1074233 RepID=A0ABW0NTX7_9MICO
MSDREMSKHPTGSDLIAAFVEEHCFSDVFVVNGGACAFMIDALGRNPGTGYVCVQHEQAAAMSADAIWRTTGRAGVTMVTSGPGATNLITGIASSWFDSIPALHITGQVNDRESKTTIGADVRQAGFQETDIVSMVSTITKSAVKVTSVSELARALHDSLEVAISGRMGPVVVDVPMNVQQEPATDLDFAIALAPVEKRAEDTTPPAVLSSQLESFLAGAERPLVVIGGGLGLAGTARIAQDWCEAHHIPYIASWAGLTYLDRSRKGYQGSQGVYGSRHANWTVNAADRILSFGSRLDNRQRTGNPRAYAPFADFFIIDIDIEEIRKFHADRRYDGAAFDLAGIESVLEGTEFSYDSAPWVSLIEADRGSNSSGWEASVKPGEFNPYSAVTALQPLLPQEAIVIADTGANLAWLFQAYAPDDSLLFTSGGNSPMGYSLPAAIGAQLANPDANVVCVIGDGGLQMNIQELQTAAFYGLPITILLFNNSGYGIIKQFQDSNTSSRHFASGDGYSTPDFGQIAAAYGLPYQRIASVEEITGELFERGLRLIELVIPPNALITPKVESDHFIHDQFPYDDSPRYQPLPFAYPGRPSELVVSSAL